MDESELHHDDANTDWQRLSVLVQDENQTLTDVRFLSATDVIVLLTPVVRAISENPAEAEDPFERLEYSLSNRHYDVNQMSYTKRDGITSAHVAKIRSSQIVILCFAPDRNEDIDRQVAEEVFAVSDSKPVIVLVCCKPMNIERNLPFPTVVLTFGYSPAAFEATAVLIFGEDPSGSSIPLHRNFPLYTQVPRVWPVEPWNKAQDMASIMLLWRQCFGTRFSIDMETLGTLLENPQKAKNFVVRHPISGDALGFCATYSSPAGQKEEGSIAYLALILVRSLHRNEGIGLSLHNYAIQELEKTPGITRIQLGSGLPRLFYGPLRENTCYDKWFHRRGWTLNGHLPGQGRAVFDFLLDFSDWSYLRSSENTFCFRECVLEDLSDLMELSENSSFAKQISMFQNSRPVNESNLESNPYNYVVAIEDGVILAAALVYIPKCCNFTKYNLPWANMLGEDVGGVTCMCLPNNKPDAVRADIRSGLLKVSMDTLQRQGMKKLFLDGVTEDFEILTELGFREWAQYREVWMDLVRTA